MASLGDKVKDRITSFEGIVTGRSEYLFGCVHLCITPTEVKDGKPPEGVWLDEDRFDVVGKGAVEPPKSAAVRAGGPASNYPPAG